MLGFNDPIYLAFGKIEQKNEWIHVMEQFSYQEISEDVDLDEAATLANTTNNNNGINKTDS